MLIGLTGGIGSGKSLVSDYLATMQVHIIDADKIARDVVHPGSAVLQQLVQLFGERILQADHTLNRAELRRLAFADARSKEKLNAIMHPAIRTAIVSAIAQPFSAQEAPYRVLSAPLLLENGLQHLADLVLVVDVAEARQFERAAARDGVTQETLAGIIRSQWRREQRLAFAHAVIDNNGTRDQTLRQVEILHQAFTALAR